MSESNPRGRGMSTDDGLLIHVAFELRTGLFCPTVSLEVWTVDRTAFAVLLFGVCLGRLTYLTSLVQTQPPMALYTILRVLTISRTQLSLKRCRHRYR